MESLEHWRTLEPHHLVLVLELVLPDLGWRPTSALLTSEA
jgi:hypothetical protein